jgi:hypothetical protein
LTDADIAAANAAEVWSDLFEAMTRSLNKSAPQVVHEDLVTGYPSTDTGLASFNTGIEAAFMSTPRHVDGDILQPDRTIQTQ